MARYRGTPEVMFNPRFGLCSACSDQDRCRVYKEDQTLIPDNAALSTHGVTENVSISRKCYILYLWLCLSSYMVRIVL